MGRNSTMTIRTLATFALASSLIAALVGCNESTDVPKSVNDAYKNRQAGPAPTAEQMKPKDGKAFVGEPSGGMPTGDGGAAKPSGPPPGAGAPGGG